MGEGRVILSWIIIDINAYDMEPALCLTLAKGEKGGGVLFTPMAMCSSFPEFRA